MRRSPSLGFAVSFLLVAGSVEAANIIPCPAKTWWQNVRTNDKRVCRQRDAGSAHVAVLAVAPWADYASKLQPDFALTSKDALANALPVTSTREEQMLSMIAAALKISLPTKSEPAPAANTNANSNATTSTNNVTNNQPPPAPISGSSAAPATKGDLDDKLPIDPIMHRLAALALFQEAKLVSMRIADTAVPPEYTPYVVTSRSSAKGADRFESCRCSWPRTTPPWASTREAYSRYPRRRFYPKVSVTPVDDTTKTLVTIRGSRFIDLGRVHARLRVVREGRRGVLPRALVLEDQRRGRRGTAVPDAPAGGVVADGARARIGAPSVVCIVAVSLGQGRPVRADAGADCDRDRDPERGPRGRVPGHDLLHGQATHAKTSFHSSACCLRK